jgi:hypothetical protein
MRQKIAVAACLLLTSFVCALAGGYLILLAFKEGDCDGGCNSGELLWSVPAILAMSVLLGWVFWLNSQRTWKSLLSVATLLVAVVMLPTAALYAYQLQQKNNLLQKQAELRANQDYSHMLLAVRDISAIGVFAGDRCIFSAVDCDHQPHQIEAICKRQGAVSIAQADWTGFIRLPKEDFLKSATQAVEKFPQSCSRP